MKRRDVIDDRKLRKKQNRKFSAATLPRRTIKRARRRNRETPNRLILHLSRNFSLAMGVSGLFKYCERHRESTSTSVDLLTAARVGDVEAGSEDARPLELLVDFADFETFVANRVVDREARVDPREAQRMRLFGVDLDACDRFVLVSIHGP